MFKKLLLYGMILTITLIIANSGVMGFGDVGLSKAFFASYVIFSILIVLANIINIIQNKIKNPNCNLIDPIKFRTIITPLSCIFFIPISYIFAKLLTMTFFGIFFALAVGLMIQQVYGCIKE